MLFTCWEQHSAPGVFDTETMEDAITEYIYQNELSPPLSIMAVRNDEVEAYNYDAKLKRLEKPERRN